MRNTLRLLLITLLTGLLLCSYSDAAMKKTQKPMPTSKGAEHKMKTYYMGRFAIDLPEDFKLEIQSNRFRRVEIEEYPNLKDAEQKWKSRLSEIEKLKKPEGVKKIIIKEQPIERLGKWARGVLYYGDYRADDECKWDIFVSYGLSGVLFSLRGLLDKEKSMYAWLKEIAAAYSPHPFPNQPANHLLYTEHGVIELPYKRQESTYARFAGPMGMKLEIEMRQIHKEPESGGIISRTIAAMATGFASGLDIEKVRSRKKTAANLPGEEEILQGSDGENQDLSFDWEYLGTVESGEKPWIQITLDTKPDNRDEKIIIWDQILNSFRPAYKR